MTQLIASLQPLFGLGKLGEEVTCGTHQHIYGTLWIVKLVFFFLLFFLFVLFLYTRVERKLVLLSFFTISTCYLIKIEKSPRFIKKKIMILHTEYVHHVTNDRT